MYDSRFRGWIYWGCIFTFCLLNFFAIYVIKNVIIIMISFFAPFLVMGIFARIENDNLLSHLSWYHRDTMDAINSDWYHRNWRMVDFLFSGQLDDDPEMKHHKRNNRHVTVATLAMVIAFSVFMVLIGLPSGFKTFPGRWRFFH